MEVTNTMIEHMINPISDMLTDPMFKPMTLRASDPWFFVMSGYFRNLKKGFLILDLVQCPLGTTSNGGLKLLLNEFEWIPYLEFSAFWHQGPMMSWFLVLIANKLISQHLVHLFITSFSSSIHLQLKFEDEVAHHPQKYKEPKQHQNVDPIHLKVESWH